MAAQRTTAARRRKRARPVRIQTNISITPDLRVVFVMALVLTLAGWWFWRHYTVTLQSPATLHWQSPIIVAKRITSGGAIEAQADQNGKGLTAWQEYACRKFGSDCRLALAIQRAENPQGKCEIYHYNTDGSLDWGYFQINTVHLQRPGLNLRDLLDCQANIDFAYQLYKEHGGFSPWSTYKNGRYRLFMK